MIYRLGAFVPTGIYDFKTCIDFELKIGESPVWDAAAGKLWFVDVTKPSLFRFDPELGRTEEFEMPSEAGSLGLVSDGRLIVALRTGIHFFDPRTQRLEFLVHPEPEMSMNRMNDGKVGPDGCFWVGSMHDALPRQPTGCLYRITSAGKVTRVLDDVRVSNGLAWSPDNLTMYHADSRGPVIRAFDFDAVNGTVSSPRTLAVLDESQGLPDGAAVDIHGSYWSAGVSAGVLNRFTADGVLVEKIKLPTPAPTMPCFGGPDLKTMFITSLSTDRNGTYSRGTLISCRVDVPGVPVGHMPIAHEDAAEAALR